MAIIPTVRCRRMAASIAFSTRVLGFECVEGDPDDGNPSFSVLMRKGDRLFLARHRGDGGFGQAIVVWTEDVDSLFRKLQTRGLKTPGRPDSLRYTRVQPAKRGALASSTSTTPDGYTLRLTQNAR